MSKDLVRAGYDAIAAQYLAARRIDSNQLAFLSELPDRLPSGAMVLDAGCGAGIPVTRWLSERFTVTGVDISEEQIRLARRFVPQATFLWQDITTLGFAAESFDAICSLYAVIHIPRDEHRPLLQNFYRLIKPGGFLLLCMGADDWPGAVEEYFGAPMYWSHYDAGTNRRMTEEAGFEVIRSELVPESQNLEATARHLFLLAQKRELGAP
jgi:SAM-dependent methyltransferase